MVDAARMAWELSLCSLCADAAGFDAFFFAGVDATDDDAVEAAEDGFVFFFFFLLPDDDGFFAASVGEY